MMESWIVLLVLAAVGVVVLGLLVLSVVLIIGERTRVAGIVLLLVVLLVLLLLGVPVFGIALMSYFDSAPINEAMDEALEAVPTDEPAATEEGDQPEQPEQIPVTDEPDPDTAATHRTSSPVSGSESQVSLGPVASSCCYAEPWPV